MPSLVQKQAGLIRITKKEIIFSNFFVNLEFLFVAPKNEKNTSVRQKKKGFLLYFKNNLIGGSPEVKIGIFKKNPGKFSTQNIVLFGLNRSLHAITRLYTGFFGT